MGVRDFLLAGQDVYPARGYAKGSDRYFYFFVYVIQCHIPLSCRCIRFT